MARPLRIEYEGAYYHVMNRGRGGCNIFLTEENYRDFLKCLAESHTRFGVDIHAYCLMGNHYHLLLCTPRGNLSRVMRHIDGVYTQRYNRRRQTDGSLFRGRYKSIVIDASSYVLQVSRYIHRNPIETERPLVKDLLDYPWSSYPAYLNKAEAPKWLKCELIYAELGAHRRYQRYQSFVSQGNDKETVVFYNQQNKAAIWGDKAFQEMAGRRFLSSGIEIQKTGMNTPLTMETVIKGVGKHFKVAQNTIRKATRGRGEKNLPRWFAMKLSQDLSGAKLLEISTKFNVSHYSTVSQTIGRLNRLLEEDEEIRRVFDKLSQDLTP